MFGIETVMDEIAMTLGKDPLDVRKLNLYKDPAISGTPDTMTTQYNQLIEDWVGDKGSRKSNTNPNTPSAARRCKLSTPRAKPASAALLWCL